MMDTIIKKLSQYFFKLKRVTLTMEVKKENYRNYVDSERVNTVKKFYEMNHTYQTYDFVIDKEREFLKFEFHYELRFKSPFTAFRG